MGIFPTSNANQADEIIVNRGFESRGRDRRQIRILFRREKIKERRAGSWTNFALKKKFDASRVADVSFTLIK